MPAQCVGSGASLHFSTGTIIAFPIVDWTKGAPSDLRVDDQWQPHNEPLGSTIPTAAGHGQPQAPMARQRGCPFLVLGGGSYESAHLASCSLDVRVGPLRRRRRTTFFDRLTRGRRVLGLSPPGSIARNAVGQQARVRKLSGVGTRATADRVTSASPASAARYISSGAKNSPSRSSVIPEIRPDLTSQTRHLQCNVAAAGWTPPNAYANSHDSRRR